MGVVCPLTSGVAGGLWVSNRSTGINLGLVVVADRAEGFNGSERLQFCHRHKFEPPKEKPLLELSDESDSETL